MVGKSAQGNSGAVAGTVIAYDVMRLFIGPSFLTPRGIDRVDLALVRHIFTDESCRHVGVLPTPCGVYAFSAKQVRYLLDYMQDLWAEDTGARGDPHLQALCERVAGRLPEASPEPATRSLAMRDKVRRMLRMLGATGLLPRRFAVAAVPRDAAYLNVGQLGLAMPSFFGWLARRPDITRAVMVHDAIPVDFPHLVGAKAPMHHRQMIRTAAEQADCVIFNSAYTRDAVTGVMQDLGHACPPALVRSLPLPAAFAEVEGGVACLAGHRYFLAVSTIEPRKNFALLLRVWRRFVATMGAAAPHLVIVGAPGKDADSIMAPLRADVALAGRVHHLVGLSSPALGSLLLGAAGMLCPSLAEGFGLPLLEAGAMGVPAVASDIPAHREVATATTTLVPAGDEDAWVRAIAALPDAPVRGRPDILAAMTEAAYCADIVEFVGAVARGKRASADRDRARGGGGVGR